MARRPSDDGCSHWQYNSSGNWDNALSWSDAWDPAQVPFAQFLIINQGSPSAPITVTLNSGGNDVAAGFGIGPYSTLNVTDGSLTVLGVADVYGLMKANSTSIDPTLTFNGPVTIFSSGEVEALGSSAKIYFSDATPPAAGTYTVDNFGAIAANGDGAVWFEQATTKNESGGIILAAGNGTVTFDQGSLDNASTVSAGASNVADGAIFFEQVTFTNESGAWVIAQNGGSITFDQATATLTNEARWHALEAANGGTLTIDSLGNVITNLGTLASQNGGTVVLEDVAIDNGGKIELNSAGSATTLQIGNVTLEGGNGSSTGPGQVVLSDFSKNSIVSDGSMAVLTNVDNTISGAGTIGDTADALFTLVNEQYGVIDANGTTHALVIDNDSPATNNFALNEIVNAGLIDATGTGGLTNENTTIDNSTFDPSTGTGVDGHIEVLPSSVAGSHIDLDNATILQGFVSIAAGAKMDTVGGSANEIETANGPTHNTSVATIVNAGKLAVGDNRTLNLASPGAIDNAGTIELNSTGDKTAFYIDQGFARINGSGKIDLSDGTANVHCRHDRRRTSSRISITTISGSRHDRDVAGWFCLAQQPRSMPTTA